MLQFWNSLKVLEYSVDKLENIRQQNEKQRQTVVEISPAHALTNDDYDANNEMINKHKRWTHLIPHDIFKMVLKHCITRDHDRTVLVLVKVCKSWRAIIMNIAPKHDFHLFQLLWNGCVDSRLNPQPAPVNPRNIINLVEMNENDDSQFLEFLEMIRNSSRKFLFYWKDLVEIPKKYLTLIAHLDGYRIEKMSAEENVKYRELCAKSNGFDTWDEDVTSRDVNIPLYIQILKHSPNLRSILLHGEISMDIFVALRYYGNEITDIEFSYCICPHFLSNLTFLGKAHERGVALQNLRSITVERGWIDFDLSLFCTYFRNIEEVTLQKKNVNGDDLCVLFSNCTKLRSLVIWRYAHPEGDWLNAFKCLTESNGVIEIIEIDCAEGFCNECCQLFWIKLCVQIYNDCG